VIEFCTKRLALLAYHVGRLILRRLELAYVAWIGGIAMHEARLAPINLEHTGCSPNICGNGSTCNKQIDQPLGIVFLQGTRKRFFLTAASSRARQTGSANFVFHAGTYASQLFTQKITLGKRGGTSWQTAHETAKVTEHFPGI
jgi:hypothetical protein